MAQNMTQGSIPRHQLKFVLPLILGELFQLGYNAVDSIVVGRFAGDDALAAVGTSAPVMNLLIIGISGLCVGAAVLMSNFFGGSKTDRLRSQLGTTIMLCVGLSLTMVAVGLFFCTPVLQFLNVPAEILPLTEQYLRIVLIGMPFTSLYNTYAAALRSVGDSKTPVKMLAVSGCLNIVLDLLFVVGFRWGVAGAALATDIAIAVSAVGCIFHVSRNIPILHLEKQHFHPDKELLGQTLRYGGTTALQQCCQPIGKLLIQGTINTLGVSTIAAFNAVGKIEDFVMLPQRQMGNTLTTFTAQNDGAGQTERMRRGWMWCQGMNLCFSIAAGLLLLPFDQQVLGLFSTDPLTLTEGGRYFAVLCFLYWIPGINNCNQGFFRGKGKMHLLLLGSLTQITGRVIFTWILVPHMGIEGVAWASAIGWAVMCVWQSALMLHMLKKLRSTPAA